MINHFAELAFFYDGSYFSYAQSHFYHDRKIGWMMFSPFHIMVENFLREKEQGYFNYRVVYAGWFQGLYHTGQSTDKQRRLDRNRHLDLMHAGVEPKYVPMSQKSGEKGVDIALTIDALQVGLEGKIDIAVLVTGDGDFVPLIRALMKNGIRVATVYFEYETEKDKAFANERLLNVSNYTLNVNELEKSRKSQGIFRGLFRLPENGTNNAQ